MEGAFSRKSIKSYQIPAMQMFLQAERGESTWQEAAYACRLYDLPEEAEYCDRQAGASSVVPFAEVPPCPTCGGVGLHRKGCRALARQIADHLPRKISFLQSLFGGK